MGKVLFNPLKTHSGAYQNLDDRGFQIMLNYRASDDAIRRVKLSQLLAGEVDPHWIRDRIILIGVSSPISGDELYTPYSAAKLPYRTFPGVLVQAQMTSQIVSAVLDRRSLVKWLPVWGDFLWVWSWATLAGFAVRDSRLSRSILLLGGAIVLSSGLSWGLFLTGYWLPLVPSVLAIFGTVGGLRIRGYSYRQGS